MISIRTKLTVVILLIILIALGALGGINYWQARSIISEKVNDDMEQLTANSASDIGGWLEARKCELSIMAVAPMVQSGNLSVIAPFLVNAGKVNKAYDAIGYAYPNGAYINSNGVKGTIAEREYFQRGMREDISFIDPVIGKTTGNVVTVISIPVKENNKVTGVLYGSIILDSLTQKVLAIKVGQTGYAYVVQNDGTFIIHPNKDMAMKYNPLKDGKAEDKFKNVIGRMVKGETGIDQYQLNGQDEIVCFQPIPGTTWSLALTVPVSEVTGTISALATTSLVSISIVLMITTFLIAWFARYITQPIRMMEEAASRIASGDISNTKLDITSNDEVGRLGKSFDKMAQNLRELIQKISESTGKVLISSEVLTASSQQAIQAATHIADSITTVAASADEQMEAADKTSMVIEQMSSNIQKVAANFQQVAAQSAQVAEKAEDGDTAVVKAVDRMDLLEETVNISAHVVMKLGERSKEIGQIVDTISNIAGQTNLLALNAAIEAARAGEQGRGFAVVAEEVRKLAEQSEAAAKKIAELIGSIQGETDKAVVAMDEGTKEVKMGIEVVKVAGDAFKEIVGLVNEVSGQVKITSAAMMQLASDSKTIVTSIKRIDELSKNSAGESQSVSAATEEQLASMEEVADSSKVLEGMARDLQTAVARFRVDENGKQD